MPSTSRSQQRLFQAAEHGAQFPLAQKLRQTMTHQQLHDFAVGRETGKPEHVSQAHPHRLVGSHDGLYITEHHRKGGKRG